MTAKKRILLVDDEPSFTRLMKLNLESNGPYEVRVQNDPGKALATAKEFKPDIVFLDVIMPGEDGGGVASAFRSDPALQGTPIVFLTAVVSKNEVIDRGNVIGGQLFLAKPVTLEDVMGAIRKCAA